MGGSPGQIRRPDTLIGVLSLMNSHVWWPDSVVDNTLAVVPLLEVVTSVLLMGGMDLREEDHLLHELILLETLVDEKVVLLVDGTVAALALSAENLEPSA